MVDSQETTAAGCGGLLTETAVAGFGGFLIETTVAEAVRPLTE